MSNKKCSVGVYDVKGRIRIPYDDEGGAKSDESDDDDDDMWLDYSGDGGGRVRSKKPKIKQVSIVNESGKKHTCKGRFPLTDIYWTIGVKVNKIWLQAPPSYFLQQDNGMKPYYASLLLDECLKSLDHGIKNSLKACFDIFCRENLAGESLTFFNLESALKEFVKSENEKCSFVRYPVHNGVGNWSPENHGDHIKLSVFNSGIGCTALAAVSHPQLVECLSTLLPYSFQDYLCKLYPSKRDLAQTIAVSSPWEFGFRQILYTKLKISGAEANLSTYDKAGYLPVTPLREKDALFIYEALKVDAQSDGHMYMPFRKMTNFYYFTKLNYKITKMERWQAALDYLDENKVIVREQFDQDVNIFLHHNWKAEVDTVKGLETILTQYEPEANDMDADFDSSDFDKVRGDRGQLKASRLISNMPIVVLSGMGGCGKTTVVTNLLKHICDRHEKSLTEPRNDELSQQMEEIGIEEEGEQSLHAQSKDEKSKLSDSKAVEKMCKDGSEEEEEDEEGEEKEEEKSLVVESKEMRLRRELKEDLLKILKDKKDTDSEEMRCFKRQILLVAPTGKAARLLGCKARLPSATIHSVVMSWRVWKDGKDKDKGKGQEVKEWMYAHVKILVIDECSLLSVRLFAAIVSILLEHAELSKLILLGDIKQLPSIEPGDFLRDTFKVFSKPSFGFSVELTQNHRSESTLIVENAKRISKNRTPTFDPEQRFYLIELEENGGDNERDQAILNLLRHNQDVGCHVQSQFVSFRNAHCRAINEICCKFYNGHSMLTTTNKKEVMDFEPGDKICLGKNHRVVNHEKHLEEYIAEIRHLLDEDRRKGSSQSEGKQDSSWSRGSDDMNRTRTGLSAAEVTSLFTGDEGDLDKTVGDLRQREGEATAKRDERRARAAQRQKEWKEKHKNGHTSLETDGKGSKKSSSSPNEEKLCNGEVFFIMDEKQIQSNDGKTGKYLILSDRDPTLPRVVCVAEKALRKDCKMKHSWVRTIHTYQGSESDTVVYYVGPAIPQNWQHVYTAVTRGKKSVYIIGKSSQLRIAVERQNKPRHSRLGQRLTDMLIDQVEEVERLKGDRLSSSQCRDDSQTDPDQTLSNSFENSDDSWMSSMPDPYFTQAMNKDISSPSTSGVKEDKGNVVDSLSRPNTNMTKRSDKPTTSIVLKHSKVLNRKPKPKVNSLVKAEEKEGDVDDNEIASFSDSDNDMGNHIDQRVPSLDSGEIVADKCEMDDSNERMQSKSPPIRDRVTDDEDNSATTSSFNSPQKCFSHSPSSRTPRKTPPRPSSSFSSLHTPPKQPRLNEVAVDTPFRDNFESTLSLDPHDEDVEDPIPSTPFKHVRRKLV